MPNLVEVDRQLLRSLGLSMTRVANDLAQARADFSDGPALHSADIEHSLTHFVESWSQQRTHLIEVLHGAANAIQTVANSFGGTDTHLANLLHNVSDARSATMSNDPTY